MEELKNRLLSKVVKDLVTDCWVWGKSKRGGYGALKVEGKTRAAHRLSYEIFCEPIPDGMYVCHTCDNRSCINPKHLFLGTHSDNMKDAYSKGRLILPTGSHFKVGHVAVNRSLSKEEAIIIKERVKNRGKTTLKTLAIDLGVSYYLLRDISCGRVYKND